ncbi:hypothetical protein AMTRI_Chr09g17070 [Amborella trichopoda]
MLCFEDFLALAGFRLYLWLLKSLFDGRDLVFFKWKTQALYLSSVGLKKRKAVHSLFSYLQLKD